METINHNGVSLMLLAAEGPTLSSEQDALDVIGQTYGLDIDMVAVPLERFDAEFFDLKNGRAGHFIQKLQNYRLRIAIVGDISARVAASKALHDFVGETNRIGHHLFVSDHAALLERL